MGCNHSGFRDGSRVYECGICKKAIGKPMHCTKCNKSLLFGSMHCVGSRFFLRCDCGEEAELFAPAEQSLEFVISLDLETTGVGPSDSIIEIGAIRETVGHNEDLSDLPIYKRNYLPRDKNGALIPAEQIWEGSRWIYTLPESELSDPATMIADLLQWIGADRHFIGRNIQDFDFRFLKNASRKEGLETFLPDAQFTDVAVFYGGRISLAECCQRANIVQEDAHRAIGDAWDCVRIFRKELSYGC